MSKKICTVAVVGAGAIGIYYGSRLCEAGFDVRFLLRSDFDHVARYGFKVESIAGNLNWDEPSIYRDSEDIGVVDLVLIALKTTANKELSGLLQPLMGIQTRLLTLQNGLGNVERLANEYGPEKVYGGLCFVCINRVGAGHVHHTAAGLIRLGAYQPDGDKLKKDELAEVVSIFNQAGVPCEAVDDLQLAQWMKLIWNIPFNGLSIALGGVNTEKLLSTSGIEDRVIRLMLEVRAVAAALGCQIDDRFLTKQIEQTKLMGPYRPSSMIDFVEGRAVEVDAIWRQPLQTAHELGLEVPELERLVVEIDEQLRAREESPK